MKFIKVTYSGGEGYINVSKIERFSELNFTKSSDFKSIIVFENDSIRVLETIDEIYNKIKLSDILNDMLTTS